MSPPVKHPALDRLDHRPWAVPARPWTWRQSWCDLLFAHWPFAVEAIRPLIPDGLTVETFDGKAWVGVVPFRMEGVSRRPLPDLPWISAFPELNVRTYVTAGGKPGVWFFSLDAANSLAVWAARRLFYLPYHHAVMSVRRAADDVRYRSVRRGDAGSPVAFAGSYRPTGSPLAAAPGSHAHWLTERYCLYARSPRGRIYRSEVHHAPWPLEPAAADIAENSMLAPLGLDLPEVEPLLHFARRLDVVVWSPEEV